MKAYKLTPQSRIIAEIYDDTSIDEERKIIWSQKTLYDCERIYSNFDDVLDQVKDFWENRNLYFFYWGCKLFGLQEINFPFGTFGFPPVTIQIGDRAPKD